MYGADYQRYKQKLERLQNKVKKSENARKDLEIKFNRLMKERNECERSASIHKSKYNTLLQHERRRLNRNEELLQMLEEVQAKAAAMASNTEKLRRLKMQQERIVLNNWRRNLYFHQHLMYPNVLFSNAVHCLPAPASYEYHNRIINSIAAGDNSVDNSRPLICERPAHFVEVQEPVYQKSNDNKSMSNTTTTIEHVPTQPNSKPLTTKPNTIPISCPTLPLLPIYHSDTNVPLFNELFHLQSSKIPLRTLETQPFTQQMMTPTQTIYDNKQTIQFKELPSNNQSWNDYIGYFPNQYKSDIINSHPISNTLNDALNHNKYLESISSSENYVPVMMPQHKISADIPLTKLTNDSRSQPNNIPQSFASSQPYSSVGYANQTRLVPQQHQYQQSPNIQYISSKNQSSFIEEPTSQQTVEPVSVSTNLTSHRVNNTIPIFSLYDRELRNKVVEPIYDTKKAHTDEIKPRESISNEKNYEKIGITNTSNTSWKNGTVNDEYSYEKELEDYNNILPHVESTDSRKSVNTPSLTDVDDLSSLARSPTRNMNNFSLDDDTHHITNSVKSSIPNKETSRDDRYHYSKGISGISETTAYYNDPPSPLPTSSMQRATGTQQTRNHFSLSNDSQEKPIRFGDKRRSSIDSGSLVKSTEDDSELQKKSIAANARRRYSVAANLLDLQKNITEPFYLKSTPAAINFRADGTSFDINRNSFDNKQFNVNSDIVGTLSGGQENKRNSIDGGAEVKIEDIDESTEKIGFNDQRVSPANVANSQQPVDVIHDNEYGRDVNQSEYYVSNNSAPYSTYETNDQAFVETAMENLNLDSALEQDEQITNEMQLKQFDDDADKIRVPGAHSKTVTWADDPHSNYKKEVTAQFYETQNISNEAPTEVFYAEESQQQFQSEYSPQINIQQGIEPNDVHYQYDSNQYEAQADGTVNANVYNNQEYYYTDQQNQYEQYESQPQQQQQDPQQYYANDMIGNDGSSMSRLSSDGYQQYQTQSTLQAQPKHDEYYSVSPGENYYSDYGDAGAINQNQTYLTNTTFDELATSSSVAVEQHNRQQQQQQQQQKQHQIEYTANNKPAADIRIPNYLQSDTDDSQTGYQNSPSNKIQQDSDFDFSTNSDKN